MYYLGSWEGFIKKFMSSWEREKDCSNSHISKQIWKNVIWFYGIQGKELKIRPKFYPLPFSTLFLWCFRQITQSSISKEIFLYISEKVFEEEQFLPQKFDHTTGCHIGDFLMRLKSLKKSKKFMTEIWFSKKTCYFSMFSICHCKTFACYLFDLFFAYSVNTFLNLSLLKLVFFSVICFVERS